MLHKNDWCKNVSFYNIGFLQKREEKLAFFLKTYWQNEENVVYYRGLMCDEARGCREQRVIFAEYVRWTGAGLKANESKRLGYCAACSVNPN